MFKLFLPMLIFNMHVSANQMLVHLGHDKSDQVQVNNESFEKILNRGQQRALKIFKQRNRSFSDFYKLDRINLGITIDGSLEFPLGEFALESGLELHYRTYKD